MIFRRAPFQRLLAPTSTVGKALASFANDTDMLSSSLDGYAKNVATEVIAVGRAETLGYWEDTVERVAA